jgi:hypothetical protein
MAINGPTILVLQPTVLVEPRQSNNELPFAHTEIMTGR